MTMAIISLVLTYALTGAIGWWVSKKVKTKPGKAGWILLVLFTILAQAILPGTRVIAIFQFEMYANSMLQGFLAGLLVGLLTRKFA